MKHTYLMGAAVLALTAGSATAGGLDRSGQSVGAIFAPDNTVTSSAGIVMPSITGSDIAGAGSGSGSYDAGETYSQTSLAFTNSINDRFNYAVIFDQPFGADVNYNASPFTSNLGGTGADLNSAAINFVGRVKIGDRFSLFGGVSAQRLNATVNLNGTSYASAISTSTIAKLYNAGLPINGSSKPAAAPDLSATVLGGALLGVPAAVAAVESYGAGTTAALGAGVGGLVSGASLPAGSGLSAGFLPGGGYAFDMDNTTSPNYFVGAAYEIPAIAMRIAGTYRFETEHTADTTENMFGTVTNGTVTFKTPASFNLEAQTGIAEGTLLSFGYRWTEFSAVDLVPTVLGTDLVNLDDSHRYTLGVARRFSDQFAASLSVSYEPKGDMNVSPLGPTNGLFGVSLGGQYTDGAMKVSGGLNYTKVGDANAEVGGSAVTAFTDNHVIGVGVKVDFTF